jgi:hypothetical protein
MLHTAGTALFVTAEDSWETTLTPRLDAAGADMDRVQFVSVVEDGLEALLTLPEHIEELGGRAAEVGADAIIFDPLVAMLGEHIDAHRDRDVRRALAPVAAMAGELGIAVVGIMHVTKSGRLDALAGTSGSLAFTASARSVLVVGPHPEDEGIRVLAHRKCNVGPLAPSLAFGMEPCTVTGEDGEMDTVRLEWRGEVDVRADQLLPGPARPLRIGRLSSCSASLLAARRWRLRCTGARGSRESARRH